MKKLSVIIPVYNEVGTIAAVIERVLATNILDAQKEIIVIDDGSTDRHKQDYQKSFNDRIKSISFARMSERGGIRAGFGAAIGDFVIIQDADLEYDPADYENLLAPLKDGEADVVFGFAFL